MKNTPAAGIFVLRAAIPEIPSRRIARLPPTISVARTSAPAFTTCRTAVLTGLRVGLQIDGHGADGTLAEIVSCPGSISRYCNLRCIEPGPPTAMARSAE